METKMANWIRYIFVMATVFASATYAVLDRLEAKFSMHGVTGTATIVLADGKPKITIALSMQQSLGVTVVRLHPMWVNYDVADKCSDAQLGQAVEGFSKPAALTTENPNTEVVWDTATTLDFLEGQSLVLITTSGVTVCSTIQRQAEVRTAVVTFRSPSLYGHVYLRQAFSTDAYTRIITDLTSETNAERGNWQITNSYRTCEGFMSHILTNVYSPIEEGADCSQSNKPACAVGDLSAKHGKVHLLSPLRPNVHRQAYGDPNLPLHGDHSINGLLMVVYPDDSSLKPACGMINLYKPRSAVSTFSHSGVKGSVKFTQDSPFHATYTHVELEGLQNQAGGYHIHLWPVPERMSSAQGMGMCGGEHVSGHFNPYRASVGVPSDSSYPAPAASTGDMYEVGDLSGKYGLLNGAQDINNTYMDWNLPLFGRNSIVGRSVVIHRNDATKSRWVCATIQPEFKVRSAQAVFTGPGVIGHVTFVQADDIAGLDTSVFARLDYLGGGTATQNHPWIISSSVLPSDMPTEEFQNHCRSATSAFNPEGITSTQGCRNEKQSSCKVGDLSTKLGKLSIRNEAHSHDKSTKMFATDTTIMTSGPHGILGRMLVIKNPEGTPLACAPIVPAHPTSLVAEFSSGSFTGEVTFVQPFGVWARPTSVRSTLNLQEEQSRLFIHELPGEDGGCNGTGQVFNPLTIGVEMPLNPSDDQRKIGDQLNPVTDRNEWTSTNLPLTGTNSIKGRSLVIVDQSNNVVACTTIGLDQSASSWTHLRAVATFAGDIVGTITMDQHVRKDGTMSDTTVLLDVQYSNDTKQTAEHNWHTHQMLVMGDSDATSGRCSSTGGHFNPFSADVKSAVYKAECSPLNPLQCELGDQAKKTSTVDIGVERKIVTDVYLPLTGRFSVQGRSIVIHAANKGAPRIACADIIPDTEVSNQWMEKVTFKTPTVFTGLNLNQRASRINSAYASSIRAYEGEVVVVLDSSTREETKATVYFVGARSSTLHSRFMSFINNNDKNFDEFNPINSSDARKASLVLTILLMVISVKTLR